MPRTERDGKGNLREVSVECVAVELVAVAQQHAEQKDNNMLNKSEASLPPSASGL